MKNFFPVVLFSFSAARLVALDLHVSPQGNDANSGTAGAPFATVEKARDAIRAIKNSSGLPAGGITVWLREGLYSQTQTLVLDSRDSGSADRPVVYSSAAGEQAHLTGARALDPGWFSKVDAASAIWGRLDPSARGQTYAVNLRDHGITDFGSFKQRGFVLRGSAPLELFFNGLPMTMGRWPNRGAPLAHTAGAPSGNQIVYSGSRPERWVQARDAWMHGLWSQTWADFHVNIASIDANAKTITMVNGPAQYGTAANRPFYVYNLLEEIDEPGEYYLDRASDTLYFWAPSALAGATILVSTLETGLVQFNGAQHVTFRDLVIEASRGSLVNMEGGDHNRIERCILRNAGQYAAMIGGTHNGLDQCEIAECGEEGIRLTGGNRASLTAGNNYVTNSRIRRTASVGWTYKPGINFEGGSGNRAANNLLEDMPHSAILFSGNNHIIEYSEITRVCQATSDAGAIYSGHDWGYRGNVIRGNFIHHIQSSQSGYGAHGVYLDDCVSGVEVSSNIFYRVSDVAIFCGGGRDNIIRNNLIASSGTGHHNDDRGRFRINNGGGDYWNLLERLSAEGIRHQEEPWASAYPACAAIPLSWDQVQQGLWRNPQNTVFSYNAGWSNATWTNEQNDSGTGVFSVYASMTGNNANVAAQFDEAASLNRGSRSAFLTVSIPGFQPLPFASIGPGSAGQIASQAPQAPILDGGVISASQVRLTWAELANLPAARATGFELERRIEPASPWLAVQTFGADLRSADVSGLNAATSYGFRLRAFNGIGSTFSNVLVLSTPANPPGPGGAGGPIHVEAETPLAVGSDVGSNGTVGVSDGNLDSGESVRLYDTGDAVRISFTITAPGTYLIGARVRAGGTTGPVSLWPGGYRFKLDGVAVTLAGDASTISSLDPAYGGCYWGTMVSAPTTLTAGSHVVEITAGLDWAVADYLLVSPLTVTPPGPVSGPPEVTVPGAMTVEATGASGARVTFVTSAIDSGGRAVATTNTPASGSIFGVGATTVSVSATDLAGNVGTKTFTVTVRDSTAPVISVPADISVTTADPRGAVVTFTTAALDGVSGAVPTSEVPASGSFFLLGTTSVTASAMDGAGNFASKTFNVTVAAGVPPAPVGLIATAGDRTVALTWQASAQATGYDLSRSTQSGGPYQTVAGNLPAPGFNDGGLTNGTSYYYVVVARTGAGASGQSVEAAATPQAVPLGEGWTNLDIGEVNYAGSTTLSNGRFTIAGSGADVWDYHVGFQYVYRNVSGDSTIIARVTSLQHTDGWAKAGVMIRDSLAPAAPFVAVYLTPGNGVAFQWRPTSGAVCSSQQLGGAAPAWVRLDRAGNTFTAFRSLDGASWTEIGRATIALAAATHVGLAVTSHNNGALTTALIDSVEVLSQPPVTPPGPVGGPPEVTVPGAMTVEATGASGARVTFVTSAIDSGGRAVATTNTPASGSIFGVGATTVSVSATDLAGNVGTKTFTVTVRDSTAPVISVPADISVTTADPRGAVVTFTTAALDGVSGAVPTSEVPASGSFFLLGTTSVTASAMDGAGNFASKTFNVTVAAGVPPAPVGLIATAGDRTVALTWQASAQATGYDLSRSTQSGGPYQTVAGNLPAPGFNDGGLTNGTSYYYVVVARTGAGASGQSVEAAATPQAVPLGEGWTNLDIGEVNYAGSTTLSNGRFTIAGSGADVWDYHVGFQYVYRNVSGDSTIIARVTSLQHTDGWAKAGVMIRDSLAPAAPFVAVYLTPGNGVAFQWRPTSGAVCSSQQLGGAAPAWVRLDRAGNTFTAFRSLDGASWTEIGRATIALAAATHVGLAVTSHNNGALTTALIDSVEVLSQPPVTPPGPVGGPPEVTVPGAMTVEATGASGARVTFVTSAIDSGGRAVATTNTPASGSIFGVGATTVSVSATDLAGNVGTKTFTVTVRDSTAPVISVPADISVTTADPRGAVVTFTTAALDGVSGAVPTSEVPASGSFFLLGTTSVTASAMDGAGNFASKTFNVTVAAGVPPAPVGLIATAGDRTVALTWQASAQATGYDLSRSTQSGGPYQTVAGNLPAPGFNDGGLTNGTSYYYVVVARTGAGASGQSVEAAATPQAVPLGEGWTNLDIGEVNYAGSTTLSNGRFTIAGSGADVWDYHVGFQYVYRNVSGDSTIIARVTSLQHTDGWAKAGVMIRDSLAPAAPFVAVYLTPGNGVAFQWRPTSGAVCSSQQLGGAAPAWVRLDRAGNTFTAFRSLDGASWTEIGRATIALAAATHVGLAVTSHNNGALTTALIDSVEVLSQPPVTPPAGPVAAGVPVRLEAEDFFSSLSDVGGNGSVGVSNGALDSGESVRLYDAGDAIQAGFTVNVAGLYRISARVRAGGTTGFTSFWPGGYRFKLDENVAVLVGDTATVSEFDGAYGGCYWGTMTSEVIMLTTGAHTMEIAAGTAWAVADYVEITPMFPVIVSAEKNIMELQSQSGFPTLRRSIVRWQGELSSRPDRPRWLPSPQRG